MVTELHQTPPFVDTHAHLEMKAFAQDLPQVIHRAHAAGVTAIVSVGIDCTSAQRTLEIAETYNTIFAIVGIHPHHAGHVRDNDLERLKQMATHTKVKAWGEIGLDFYRNLSPQESQREIFRQQIAIAKE